MWIVPFHFWKSTDRCAIKKILFYSISLSSFITLSSVSFFFFFLSSPQFIFSVLTSLPFFFFFFLSPEPQPLLFSCFFFPLFLFSVTFYAPSLSFFFPCHSPSLSFFFFFLYLGCCHWDRLSLWSSASPMRPSLWRSLILISLILISLFFFFFSFGCGFHVIVIMGELVLFQALFFGIVLCWFWGFFF